jgi:hypothetical protein
VSSKLSSSCLLLPPPLTVTSILHSLLFEGSSYARYDQSTYSLFFLSNVACSSPNWIFVIFLFGTRSIQLISFLSRTTFQNFPGISDLLSEVSKFQLHIVMLQMQHFTSSFFKSKSNLLTKNLCFLLSATTALAKVHAV